jgi:hypothetical protein
MLLLGPGICLLKDPADRLVFVGGEYYNEGKLLSNDKVLWLMLSTLEHGAYNVTLPVSLSSPHVSSLGPSELIVAGGYNLTTKHKSKRAMSVDFSSGTVAELPPLSNALATLNAAPVSSGDFVVFLSWPRLTFYSKASKAFVNRSLRKNEAFRTEGLTYKRHGSMDSDVSSTEYEGNIHAVPLSDMAGGPAIKRLSTREAKAQKSESEFKKMGEANKLKADEKTQPEEDKSEDEDSPDEGKRTVQHLGSHIKQQSLGLAPDQSQKAGDAAAFRRTKGGFQVQVKQKGNKHLSSPVLDRTKQDLSTMMASPKAEGSLMPLSQKFKNLVVKTEDDSQSSSSDDGKATVRPSYMKFQSPISRAQVEVKQKYSKPTTPTGTSLSSAMRPSVPTTRAKTPNMRPSREDSKGVSKE